VLFLLFVCFLVLIVIWNNRPGLIVAVKYIYKKEQDKDYETKFQSEISIIGGLRHPNIINFIGWSNNEDDTKYPGMLVRLSFGFSGFVYFSSIWVLCGLGFVNFHLFNNS
jgi:hypothetical protein